MGTKQTANETMDQYTATFPPDVQEVLERIRVTVRRVAPDAEETIKYGMPTFTLNGNLIYFGAFKKHIGFYPGSKDVRKIFKALSIYEGKEGSLKFPLDRPIPYDLIEKIVKFRVKENLKKPNAKKSR